MATHEREITAPLSLCTPDGKLNREAVGWSRTPLHDCAIPGSGRTDGRTVGLQFGGKWTQGTGLTENALCVDGLLTKIGEELEWSYDLTDPLAPWRVRIPSSDQVDLVFAPFHERADRTDAGVIVNDTTQCFGHYEGTVRTDDGAAVTVRDLLGFAEHVHMRW